MIRKVHIPRWSMPDEPLATFYPKTCNGWNARIAPIYCRKWRGPRRRLWRALIQRGLAPTPWERNTP